MKKTKLTRSLMAAVSVVALSAVMYGCVHSGDDAPPAMEDPAASVDTDGDGMPDITDTDDDNDGVADAYDDLPLDRTETTDTDGDGVGNNADLDDDGDNVLDADDAFPLDAAESADTDGDMVGDNADAFPMDATETMDSDGDMVGDNADAFPMDATETMDSDGDMVGDNADAFPMDATETMDSDGDMVGDNADAFPNDPTETMDSDGDMVGDNADAFPMDATETMDSDGDMVGDNADAFPMDATETMDSDGDMVGDNADAFPNDPTETMDSDGDMVGDNADAFPNDPTETMDSDGDMVGDNADAFDDDPNESADTDGDGVRDNADAFPTDPTEHTDADGDGRGDNAYPPDRDGDGVADVADAFPDDPMETMDSDGDGVGNNADAFPFDAAETMDSDGDGVGDNSDWSPMDAAEQMDSDMDGVGDNADAFPMDATETADADMDGVGDNADPDDDNDNIYDVWEGSSGLILMANAQHITARDDDLANTPLNESVTDANENQDVVRAAHVTNVNTAVHATSGGPLNTDVTAVANHGGLDAAGVVATWPHSATVANADADEDTERTGKPLISVDPGGAGGDAVALRHAGPGADGVDGTADDLIDNFVQGPGLGDFVHEKYISGIVAATDDAGTDIFEPNTFNNQRVILFTDLTQATEPRDARTDTVDNAAVSIASRVGITADIVDATATVPRNFPGTYDHDGDPMTPAFSGTFTCADPLTCVVSRTGTANDGSHVDGETEVTSIANYRFTGTRTITEMNPEEDTTWLAFGVWLTEIDPTGEETVHTYAFGAFADGGDATESTEAETVTGTATYRGKAAGVHSTATAVELFRADAMLEADFDAPAGATNTGGTITGMIHDIMAGDRAVSDSIELVLIDPGAADPMPNITAAGAFNGRARMTDTGEQDDSGEDIYRMTGTWAGNFYNAMADDPDTTPLNEATRAPGAVAGTFGVGRADDTDTMDVDETESYVGAFGAYCVGADNCNPND